MKLEIKNESLFIEKAYIDGRWVDADDKSTLDVINPVNQEIIGQVPNCGAEETNVAINAAAEAQKKWQKYPAKEKASILRDFYDLLCSNQDDLAKILTYEQGKPLAEAIGEIAYSASFIEWFAEEAKRVYGDLIPGHMHDRRTLVIKQPIGVVASITPWNFPSAMLARKVGPALATGCSLVCKPAKQTPFSALAFAYLAEEAGVPKGLLNVLTGNAQTIGKALTDSEVVRKLTFTGSTEVGKMLLKECAKTVKRVSMELGGHAPFIVFEDADIEAAIAGAIAAKYRNTGQTCVCANRIYVHQDIYEIFSKGLLTLAHWDYRVENLFFTPEVDDLTVIDWQLMMAHKPGWDLAYLLCTNIKVDLRRKIFDESCEAYLSGLRDSGIDFGRDELNKNMMLSLLAMMTFPVVGGANYDLENKRSKKLFEVLTERLFSSIEDYEAISYID